MVLLIKYEFHEVTKMFKLIKQIRLKFLESELERLEKEDGCLRIYCDQCEYLRQVNAYRWTCKREDILTKINRLK